MKIIKKMKAAYFNYFEQESCFNMPKFMDEVYKTVSHKFTRKEFDMLFFTKFLEFYYAGKESGKNNILLINKNQIIQIMPKIDLTKIKELWKKQ